MNVSKRPSKPRIYRSASAGPRLAQSVRCGVLGFVAVVTLVVPPSVSGAESDSSVGSSPNRARAVTEAELAIAAANARRAAAEAELTPGSESEIRHHVRRRALAELEVHLAEAREPGTSHEPLPGSGGFDARPDPSAARGTAGGAITGTLTAHGTATPIVLEKVEVFDQSAVRVDFTYTNGAGSYEISGLPTGNYFARTQSSSHADELYDDIPCLLTCDVTAGTPILVTSGETTAGIDFVLGTDGGVITGRVTDATSGVGLDEEMVLYDSGGAFTGVLASTQADGTYRFAGLPTGTYYVRTFGYSGYTPELYDSIPWAGDVTVGTPISVTFGVTTSGIDFTLNAGATITGTLVDADSSDPIVLEKVEVFDQSAVRVGFTYTDGAGVFTILSLETGTYYARTQSSSHADELYDDIPCLLTCNVTSGTSVPAVEGEVTSGIDFALGTGGGEITGTVLDVSSGTGVDEEMVLYDFGGAFTGVLASTQTDGTYRFAGLPTGTYYVRTFGNSGFPATLYEEIPWDEANDATEGTPIEVIFGETTAGIDFIFGDGIFENGFELGTTGAWSQTSP